MRHIMIGLSLFLVLFTPISTWAEEAGPSPPALKLGLQEAIMLALSNNVDIRIERLNPEIAEAAIEAEESVFDPAVTAETGKNVSKTQTPVARFLTGSLEPSENAVDVQAGVQKKFTTGGTAQLQSGNNRLNSNSFVQRFDPQYTTDLTLSVTQPLFKDFGRDFNMTGIFLAKNNKEISDTQFRQRVIDVIATVKEAYWNLVGAIELLDVAEQSVQQAQELVEINQAKVEAGQLAPIDVIEAEAGVAAREEAVILAEDLIRDIEDQLRNLLYLDGELPKTFAPIIPLDQPTDARLALSLRPSIDTALKKRPDYLQTKIELENRLLTLKAAENQVRPRVDLVASAGVNGLGGTYGDSLDEMDGDYYDLRIGLRFEYPLGNRAARSQVVQRKLEQRQVELRLDDLEKIIALEVKEAVRQVETDFKRIRTTRVARILAEKKLEAEQAKFEVGISTTKDVLDFQIDLAQQRSRELQAIIDYNNSRVRLHRSMGTTLEENKVALDVPGSS